MTDAIGAEFEQQQVLSKTVVQHLRKAAVVVMGIALRQPRQQVAQVSTIPFRTSKSQAYRGGYRGSGIEGGRNTLL